MDDHGNTPTTIITDEQSRSQSVVVSPGVSSSPPVCWAAHVTAAAVAISVVVAVAPVLPELAKSPEWWKFPAGLFALALVAAPTGAKDVLAVVQAVLRRGGDK